MSLVVLLYIAVGLAAGVMSGLMGIGGGTIMIPMLIYFFGLTQHEAQGTTLAVMIPPIGLLAAWVYYRNGHVKPAMAVFICIGFLLGGFIGAKAAGTFSSEALRRFFGVFLLMISLQMIFSR